VGRGHDAHVDGDCAVATHRLEAPFLEYAQHLGLGLRRHVADLVEEDRAAVRRLELADAARVGAGERALLVTEELALDQLARDRGAVHRDEGARAACAALVERLGDELLAGAALAADQHREIGLGDLLDRLEDLAHRAALADQVLEAVLALDPLEQHAVLALKLGALERMSHHDAQLLVVEGLGQVVLGALLHGLDRDFLAAVRGDHHDRRLGTRLAARPQHVHAGDPAAQREVGDDQVVSRLAQLAQRVLAGVGQVDVVAVAPQQAAQRELDALLVLDDQDSCAHLRASALCACLGKCSVNSVP
jgi:hypothetical protein